MNNTLDYIEDYFCNRLSLEEKEAFESRCATEEAFASEVAFYVATRAALKEQVHANKRKDFEGLYEELSKRKGPGTILVTLWPYIGAVAACVILFFGWLVFMQKPSPDVYADQYIRENMETLSVNMGTSQDSFQLGIAAYNKRDYEVSEKIFKSLALQKDNRAEAVKYLGFVYLITGKYETAVLEFDTLSGMKNLYANPGYFYKALALLKTGKAEDVAIAKELLKTVKEQKRPGYKEAQEWKLN